jgi:putative aldouronate transport system permease protein
MRTKSSEGRIFEIINNTLLFGILLIVLYPLIYVASSSLSNPVYIANGDVWLMPRDFTFNAYKRVFANSDIITGYRNSIIYTILGTTINLILTSFGAYALSRKDLVGRNFFTIMFAFTMFFSGGMIPTFLVVRDLGLIDSMWSLILPTAVSVWNMVIMRTYFQNSIPYELQEAGFIEGFSDIGVFTRIVLPLSKPIIAVMVLYYGVTHWNSYFQALMYISDRSKYPLQLFLRHILLLSQMSEMNDMGASMSDQILESESIRYAVIVVASVPVLMLYPFVQKYFVKGIMVGSIKG